MLFVQLLYWNWEVGIQVVAYPATLTQNSSSISSFSTSSNSLTEETESKLQTLKLNNSSPSTTRHWRPATQWNLRNQWSKLVSQKQQWAKASSSGRSHLTSLVNSYLSQRYMRTLKSYFYSQVCYLGFLFYWVQFDWKFGFFFWKCWKDIWRLWIWVF